MADQVKDDIIGMSWKQRFNFVRALSLVFAVTIMVFTRRRLGFRLINQSWLLVMMIVMLGLIAFFQDAAGPRAWLLAVYAVAMFALGMLQRWLRWHDLCNGVRWHTYSRGVSWLEYFPWPAFIRSHERLTRYVEPVIVMIIGFVIGAGLSRALGVWLVWSGIFLFVFEQDAFETLLAQQLDVLDGLVSAEVQEEIVEHFQQPQLEQKRRSIEDTAGIATGVAPDIQAQIESRRAKQRKEAPDNLVNEVAESLL